jgi:hypothetical protein
MLMSKKRAIGRQSVEKSEIIVDMELESRRTPAGSSKFAADE